MKTVFSPSELPHIWARQSQDEGKTSNRSMFFVKTKIYSYGYHFCAANIIDSQTVLITDRKYSVTTSRHMSDIKDAVRHFNTRLFVPYPEMEGGAHEKNFKQWTVDLLNHKTDSENTRRKEEKRNDSYLSALGLIQTIEKYCEITGQTIPVELQLSIDVVKGDKTREDIDAYHKAETERKEQAIRKALQERIKEEKKALVKWRKGGANTWRFSNLPAALRLSADGMNVETSQGAVVSLESAKLLFTLIQRGTDIKGHSIDGYTVISLNGVLTIGCHKIERKEINRFAKSQGWGQIDNKH